MNPTWTMVVFDSLAAILVLPLVLRSAWQVLQPLWATRQRWGASDQVPDRPAISHSRSVYLFVLLWIGVWVGMETFLASYPTYLEPFGMVALVGSLIVALIQWASISMVMRCSWVWIVVTIIALNANLRLEEEVNNGMLAVGMAMALPLRSVWAAMLMQALGRWLAVLVSAGCLGLLQGLSLRMTQPIALRVWVAVMGVATMGNLILGIMTIHVGNLVGWSREQHVIGALLGGVTLGSISAAGLLMMSSAIHTQAEAAVLE